VTWRWKQKNGRLVSRRGVGGGAYQGSKVGVRKGKMDALLFPRV
jgi:hypothetical protein